MGMAKPTARRCARLLFVSTMAAASTDSNRRTASRCTRPTKPVPKIAVLICFIVFSILYPVLDAPGVQIFDGREHRSVKDACAHTEASQTDRIIFFCLPGAGSAQRKHS